MRPHFAALDGVHHRPAKQIPREGGVIQGKQKPRGCGGEEDRERSQRVGEGVAEDLRVGFSVEAQDAAGVASPPHVDHVVRASQQLV